jgi:GTP-binding protein
VDAVDTDSEDVQEIITKIQQITQSKVFLISAVSQMGLNDLMQEVWRSLDELSLSENDNYTR